MATQGSNTRRSLLFVGLLLAACDPVRPGDYQGNPPSPSTLDLSLVPNLTRQVGTTAEGLYLQDGRMWYPGGGAGDSFHPNGRARVESALWPGLVLGMSTFNYGLPVNSPVVAFGFARLWAYGMSPEPYISHDEVAIGQLAVAPNHVLVASDADLDVQPVGPSGPTLSIKAGYQILHRTCSPENPNQFEILPPDAVITLAPSTTWDPHAPDSAYLTACGLTLTAPDLGQLVPVPKDGRALITLGDSEGHMRGPMQSLAWSPDASTLYFLTGYDGWEAAKHLSTNILGSVEATSLAISVLIGDGHFAGPLQVATGGTSLLLNQVTLHGQFTLPTQEPIRISLQSGAALFAKLPGTGLLSPDGNTLAYADRLYGLTTGIEARLDPVSTILAWAPDGKAMLVMGTDAPPWSSPRIGHLIPTDGSSAGATLEGLPTTLSWDVSNPCPVTARVQDVERNRRTFWTASGPKVVTQDCRGVLVQDLATQRVTEFIEPNRVAVVDAPLQAVVATDQLFAWALQCFGIGETSCNAELRRLSLATGARDVVAKANKVLVFAVSPDGKNLALAVDTPRTEKYSGDAITTDIYIKDLVP